MKDKAQTLPDIGESVAVLFSGQGLEQGVVLGAHYTRNTPSPAQEAQLDYVRYEDGTELWYDRTGHKLVAKVKGSADVTTEKEISAESQPRIILKAPIIELQGNLVQTGHNGGKATSLLRGNQTICNGDVTADGVSLNRHVHTGCLMSLLHRKNFYCACRILQKRKRKIVGRRIIDRGGCIGGICFVNSLAAKRMKNLMLTRNPFGSIGIGS